MRYDNAQAAKSDSGIRASNKLVWLLEKNISSYIEEFCFRSNYRFQVKVYSIRWLNAVLFTAEARDIINID